MEQTNLRLALRQHTDDLHRRVDATVGAFHDIRSYGAFLTHSLRFRQMVEPALTPSADWTPQSLLTELALDSDDLALPHGAAQTRPLASIVDESTRLGALYVLEGSALGAHLLFERARALGLSAERGARHLAKQVGASNRWREFVQLLDSRRELDRTAVLAGARHLFETALSVYAGAK